MEELLTAYSYAYMIRTFFPFLLRRKMMMIEMEDLLLFPSKGTQQKDFLLQSLRDANDAPSFIGSRGHISYFSSF